MDMLGDYPELKYFLALQGIGGKSNIHRSFRVAISLVECPAYRGWNLVRKV